MEILGVDPGTSVTGFGIVSQSNYKLQLVDYGAVRTDASDPMEQRLLRIYRAISGLVESHDIAAVAVEKLFFNKNVQSAMMVGQARGVIMLAAASGGVPVLEYTPQQVKVAVTGHGAAPKKQVQAMVQSVLGMHETPSPDDAADGLALAVCGLHRWEWDRRLGAET